MRLLASMVIAMSLALPESSHATPCQDRCPQGLDIARIMETLTQVAQERGIAPKVPQVALFNKVFLKDANLFGRVYELGLMGSMNLAVPDTAVAYSSSILGNNVAVAAGIACPPPCASDTTPSLGCIARARTRFSPINCSTSQMMSIGTGV